MLYGKSLPCAKNALIVEVCITNLQLNPNAFMDGIASLLKYFY
jgi:hypothetical protein